MQYYHKGILEEKKYLFSFHLSRLFAEIRMK